MATCDFCTREMLSADGCIPRLITYQTGERLPAIPYGAERHSDYAPSQRCHDCNVKPGEYHHPNCDMEECPRCGGQLISCHCKVESFVEQVPAPRPVASVKELETVGGFPFRVFEKDAAQIPAPAPFPPAPDGGKLIARAVTFPGVGLCDVYLTDDIASPFAPTTDVEQEPGGVEVERFIHCYSTTLARYTFTRGYFNERREYIAQSAVQLRVRPGSDEARIVQEILALFPLTGGK